MDDLSLDMSHEIDLTLSRQQDRKKLAQEGPMCETGMVSKKKRPMRGLRTKARTRRDYAY